MKPRDPDEGGSAGEGTEAAHLGFLFLFMDDPIPHVTRWSLCCGFLAVSLVWGSTLAVRWFPVLCFRDSHSVDVGEGGHLGLWGHLLLTCHFSKPLPDVMWTVRACLMPPSYFVGKGGPREGRGTLC